MGTGVFPRSSYFAGAIALASLFSGCLNEASVKRDTLVNAAVSQVPGGPRFVRVKFFAPTGTSTNVGSFNLPNNGTAPGFGHGIQAVRFFDEHDQVISSVPWLDRVEVSISGGPNTSATNSNCFRFSGLGEQARQCLANGVGTTPEKCGAPDGFLRLSESDCSASGSTITQGNGSDTDGVYFGVKFNRDPSVLAAHENIQVGITYTASALRPSSTDPSNCFDSGGTFTPGNPDCSDLAWHVYLKDSTSSVVNPFKLFIPPVNNMADSTKVRRSGASTQMFVVPLAYNSLQYLIFSRTNAMDHTVPGSSSTNLLSERCNDPSSGAANSPGCLGLVLVDMTLSRI